MKPVIFKALMFGLVALVGCAGTPNVYYTLSPAPTAALATKATDASTASKPTQTRTSVPYVLANVTVPAQVDDTPLIVRLADDRLMILTHDRWTASLGSLIQNALAQNLTLQLGMPPLQSPDMVQGIAKAMRVSIDVQRFDMVPGQYADLDAVWEVRSLVSDRQKPIICYSRLRQTVDVGVAPLVAAQQANITRLSTQIAEVLSTGKPPASVTCQTA
jgi:uncharacterized protein